MFPILYQFQVQQNRNRIIGKLMSVPKADNGIGVSRIYYDWPMENPIPSMFLTFRDRSGKYHGVGSCFTFWSLLKNFESVSGFEI